MFLNPWAIGIGVLAAGIPMLIHWLTRPKPVRLPLSTLRFVEVVVQERRALWRLRDALLLALRTLAVLAIAAAIARPWLGAATTPAAASDARVLRVVILDTSQSMAARSGSATAFDRARPIALQNLQYQSGLEGNLILAAAKPVSVFPRPSSNFVALHEALAGSRPMPERLRIQDAINLAADMLARGGSEAVDVRRELVVVSDFSRSNWAVADFSPLPESTEIRLESVAPKTIPANLAVLGVSASGRIEIGREARLEVVVGNYSPSAARVRVEIEFGATAHQLEGDCPPYARTTLSGEVIAQQAGWQIGRVRLLANDDALPEDDERAFAIEVRPPPVYAIISRDRNRDTPTSSYFLERALAPYEANEQRQTTRVLRIQPESMDRETVGQAEILVLNHPGKLSNENVQLLAALHRRGRGILYVASEPVDSSNLQAFNNAVGPGLQFPVDFSPAEVGQPRRNLFIVDSQRTASPFDVFGDQLSAMTGELRFSGGLLTRRRPDALAEDVLATLNDQTAFMVNVSSQAGAVVVLNADLDESNLHSSPLFVPLLGELMQQRLSGGRKREEPIVCGEPFALLLPAELESAANLELISGSDGGTTVGELAQEAQGVVWRGNASGPPGVNRVRRGEETVFAMATGIPAEESDLRDLPSEVFKDRLAGGRSVQFRSAENLDPETHDSFWSYLAVICVGCLLGEVAVLRIFRS